MDRNTSIKVVEKLSKYKDLEIASARMWKMEKETLPIVIVEKKMLTKFQAPPASTSSKK